MKRKVIPGSRFIIANIIPVVSMVGILVALFALNWWQSADISVTGARIIWDAPTLVEEFAPELLADETIDEDAIASQLLILPNMPRIANLGIVLGATLVGGALALFSIFKVELGNTIIAVLNFITTLASRFKRGVDTLLERWSFIGMVILSLLLLGIYFITLDGTFDIITILAIMLVGTQFKLFIHFILGLISFVAGIIFGLLRMPFETGTERSVGIGIATAGLVIWLYYLIYITQNTLPDETFALTLGRVTEVSGIAFWLIFVLSLGFVGQFFFKREGVEYYTAPWWLVILFLLWMAVVTIIPFNDDYNAIYSQLQEGVSLTIYLAFTSYAIAIVLGLITGIIRANPPQPPAKGMRLEQRIGRVVQTIIYNAVTFYVEFMRGIPPLVFLLISGFIIVPAVREGINVSFLPFVRDILNNPDIPDLVWRGRDAGTAIAGLSLVYGAFLSEVFRAGIQSIDKGQIEAARSLGMRYTQVMRYIVVPQAVRRMLPPLGNNFISMVKDTSLVTILGTNEITQIARKWSGSTFLYVETYLVLSLIYLTMTITGSLLVQLMERQLRRHER
jgi:polar amino acid transport system permease protein